MTGKTWADKVTRGTGHTRWETGQIQHKTGHTRWGVGKVTHETGHTRWEADTNESM